MKDRLRNLCIVGSLLLVIGPISQAIIGIPAVIKGNEPNGFLEEQRSALLQKISNGTLRQFGAIILAVASGKGLCEEPSEGIEIPNECTSAQVQAARNAAAKGVPPEVIQRDILNGCQ